MGQIHPLSGYLIAFFCFCIPCYLLLIDHGCYSEKQRKCYNKVTTCLKIKIQVRSNEHLNLDLILISSCSTCFD